MRLSFGILQGPSDHGVYKARGSIAYTYSRHAKNTHEPAKNWNTSLCHTVALINQLIKLTVV